jgi:hypothetical protein
LRDTDGRAVLAATGDKVRSVLEVSGLMALIEEYDSPEAAVAALTGGNGHPNAH